VRECSEIMGIAEQTLMNELNRLIRKKLHKGGATPQNSEEVPPQQVTAPPQESVLDISDCSAQELDVIRVLLHYASRTLKFEQPGNEPDETITFEAGVAEYVCNDLRANQIEFDNPVMRKIFEAYADGVDNKILPDDRFFLMHPEPEVADLAINIITQKYELSPGWEEIKIYVPVETDKLEDTVSRAVLSLMHRKLSAMIFHNQKIMKELPSESEAWSDHLSRDIHLKQARNEISRRLGRILNG
jgi:DNA primase